MTLNLMDISGEVDLDYFREIISRTASRKPYQDQLAMRQMSNQVNSPEGKSESTLKVIEEFESALHEIKNNERDLKLLEMATSTLLERTNELQGRCETAEAASTSSESKCR